ncbi:hypothetical protein LRP88_14415 [Fusarium phalaenopsidis]
MASRNCLDSPDSYAVAWIAALPIERAAAKAMLDEEHAAPTGFARHQTDANVYTWGRVGEHNIVIASLPAGVYGTTSAATTASGLLASLPSIRVGLLVGIGGGIARPDDDRDIRLGDIVVSQPDGTAGGVCQYDLTKAKTGDRRERKGFLGRPPAVLLNALASIQADHELEDSKVPCFLQQMLEKNPKMSKRSKQSPGYAHQGFDNDRLFGASSGHVPGPDCRGCDAAGEVQRDPRDTTDPDIHYGTIASGNTLVKDAAARDRIIADVGEDCICFEMEAAGLMNHFPCLVIRGICDYADSHKNDRWQRYASATAAAYAKELLAYVPAAEVQETKRALEVLQSVQQQIDGVQQTAVATKAATDSIRSDLRTDKIKRWLYPPDPSTNANHARKLRHEGTGAWLLENPVFQEWYSGSRRYLWLYGLAGCGKTVLSATMLDHLAKGSDRLILSFFFDFSDTAKQTLDGMLRSLAFQLYQGGAGSASLLNNSFQAHQDGRDQPATKALSDVLFKMLAVQKKVSIVLDALDESTTRGELLLWIKDVVSKPELRHVQLICTGRPEPEFMRGIPSLIGEDNCLALDKDSVNADIRSYVAAQLSQRRDFRDKPLSQDLLEEIRKKVGNGADGMFSLVTVVHDTDRELHLAHFSVKEYLLRENQFKVITASIPITRTCLTYLTDINGGHREIKQDFPMARYAAEVWTSYAVVAQASEDIARATATFLEEEATFQRWARLYQPDRDWDDNPGSPRGSRLYYACFVGLVAPVRDLIGKGADVNAQGGEYGNALQAAAFGGHQEIVELLLAQGADINAQGGDYGNALQAAAVRGHLEIVELLLAQGADINAQGGDYGNALYAAAVEGHQEIVELLLAQGADINAQGDRFGNAFQAAAFGGHQEIVELLLAQGADINAQGGDYGNALQAAAVRGHLEIVELLLAQGADINAQGGDYGNALYAAAVEGHQEIVELLLDKGADVNAQGGYYGNALYAAAVEGHQEIVELLLDKGADINAQGGYYGNALQAAAVRGHLEIVELLLAQGADINAQGGDYGNALYAAAVEGHQEIVELLLDKGADINAQGGYYGNALYAAAVRGHLEIARLLLDKGADVNAQGGDYGNALQAG